MLDIKKISQEVLENKIKRNFPTNDIIHEFSLLKDEVKEAEEVLTNPEKLKSELADLGIYLISLARISGIDIEKAIEEKIEYNKNRTHKKGTITTNGAL